MTSDKRNSALSYINNIPILNSNNMDINNFNKTFYEIRRTLHIKQLRKYQIDSLLKRVKCKFCQNLNNIMKFSLQIPIKKLPQYFITNITIDYNQLYFEKTILEIYNEFNLIEKSQAINDDIIKLKNKGFIKELFNKTLEEIYNIYINSDTYKKELKNIYKKCGKNIGILYEFVSKNMLLYYKYHKMKEIQK